MTRLQAAGDAAPRALRRPQNNLLRSSTTPLSDPDTAPWNSSPAGRAHPDKGGCKGADPQMHKSTPLPVQLRSQVGSERALTA